MLKIGNEKSEKSQFNQISLEKYFTDIYRKKLEAALGSEMNTLLPLGCIFNASMDHSDVIQEAICVGLEKARMGFDPEYHFRSENVKVEDEDLRAIELEKRIADRDGTITRALYRWVKEGAKQWLRDTVRKYASMDVELTGWEEQCLTSTLEFDVLAKNGVDVQDAIAISLDLKFAQATSSSNNIDVEEVAKIASRLKNVFCRRGDVRFQELWKQLSPQMQQAVIAHYQEAA